MLGLAMSPGSDTVTACATCEAPGRLIWPPSKRQPSLDPQVERGWLTLFCCPTCGSLWMGLPYEPYAAFLYLALWTYSADDWSTLDALDKGQTLIQWFEGQIRAAWKGLNERDRADIEHHSRRSYGRSPVDGPADSPTPDIGRLLAARRSQS